MTKQEVDTMLKHAIGITTDNVTSLRLDKQTKYGCMIGVGYIRDGRKSGNRIVLTFEQWEALKTHVKPT